MNRQSFNLLFATADPLRWHIEESFALSALGKFFSNTVLGDRSNVVELFERQKAAQAPALLDASGGVVQVGATSVLRGYNIPQGSVMRLNLIGPMMANGDWCSWGMDDFEEAITLANQNPNISGIFIRANTGGGESLAGQILHNAVKSSKKPVVVYADFLGSAGVHGTLAASEIIASGNASRIGSIGTYVSIDKELANWYNENVEDIYAEGSEEKNAEWRAYLKGDTGPLKTVVTKNAEMFRQEVKKYRPIKSEDVLKGGMYFGQEAKKNGLIDGIGTYEYAIQRMAANIKRANS